MSTRRNPTPTSAWKMNLNSLVSWLGFGRRGRLASRPAARSPRRRLHLEPLEARELLSVTPLFIDQDGDQYKVQLVGAGAIVISQDDVDADGKGAIAQIALHDTDPAKSKLTVTVTKGASGDGLVNIGSITASSGLQSISAPASNLSGAGITVTGLLGSLKIRDVLTGAAIQAGGTVAQKTSVVAHVFQDNTSLELGSAISTFQAAALGTGSIKAPAIATLKVAGDAKAKVNGVLTPIAGDFKANVTLTGTGNPLKPITLGPVTIAGAITDAIWQVTGNVGPVTARGLTTNWTFNGSGDLASLTLGAVASANLQATKKINSLTAARWTAGSIAASAVNTLKINGDFGATVTLTGNGVTIGKPTLNTATVTGAVTGSALTVRGIVNSFTAASFVNSRLFVGFTPTDPANPMQGGTFTAGSKLNNFKITATTNAFANSFVAAPTIGVVNLASVQSDGSGTPFGVISEVSIKKLTVKSPSFTFDKAAATHQGVGDFQEVRVTVSKIEEYEQQLGANPGVFNWSIHNELRHLYIAVDQRKSSYYTDVILQHSVMDNYMVNILSGWKIGHDSAKAIVNFQAAASKFPEFRFLAAACWIKIGDLQADLKQARTWYQKVIGMQGTDLAAYKTLAQQNQSMDLAARLSQISADFHPVTVFTGDHLHIRLPLALGTAWLNSHLDIIWANRARLFDGTHYYRVYFYGSWGGIIETTNLPGDERTSEIRTGYEVGIAIEICDKATWSMHASDVTLEKRDAAKRVVVYYRDPFFAF